MPRGEPSRGRIAMLVLALSPLVLLAVEALAHPFSPATSDGIHGLLSPLCHQDPARSPSFFGHAIGACHRCLGVHLGIALIVIGWSHVRRLGDPRAFSILLAIGGLDWALCRAAISMDHPLERLLAGAALGAGLALAVASAARWVRAKSRDMRSRLRVRHWLA